MILIDQKPLEIGALNNPDHPQYDIAVEYNNTIDYLKKHYRKGYVRFVRPGYPKHTKGADGFGREVAKMMEPTPPMRIPLRSNVALGKLGKHAWACALDAPIILPNQLFDLGSRRAISIKNDFLVNVEEEPDLAFFLYKLSPFVRRGLLKVFDPTKDDIELGIAERELSRRKYAIWDMLTDEAKLKTMARAYGVTDVDNKQPNSIRKELESTLTENDKLRRKNPAIKGTEDFMEEMAVTDGVLLRSFVQKAIDDNKLKWHLDGRWKIGQKVIVQVPSQELNYKTEYLCSYLLAGNNAEKYTEFIRDLITKEYLDTIDDKKEWQWLYRVMGETPSFKRIEEIKTRVTEHFCPV